MAEYYAAIFLERKAFSSMSCYLLVQVQKDLDCVY